LAPVGALVELPVVEALVPVRLAEAPIQFVSFLSMVIGIAILTLGGTRRGAAG